MNKLQLPDLGYFSSHAVLRSEILLTCTILRCQLKGLNAQFCQILLAEKRLVYDFCVFIIL